MVCQFFVHENKC